MSSVIEKSYPISLLVNVEIKPDRVDEFLKVIEADAIGSRNNENGGCLRFDVLRNKSKPNSFTFYEVLSNLFKKTA
jgi:quinol monooxygenase YgiN